MPVYEYECSQCEYTFETHQGFDDKPKKKCPECGKYKLYKVISVGYISVKQEPTTLGHQAARNTEQMSQSELASKRRKDQQGKDQSKLNYLKQQGTVSPNATELPKNKSWYNTRGADLSQKLKHIDTPQKQTDYILKGTE